MATVIDLLPRKMRDGLRNLASGLGIGGQDKTASAQFILSPLARQEIDACYRGTWLGRKIHDIPAKDMTREWRAWQAEDDQIEAIENEEKRLNVRALTRKALVLARLYGGCGIVMGLPGDAATPAPSKIGKGQLRYLHVMHRWDLTLGDQVRDLGDPLFGKPQHFRLGGNVDALQQVDIHPSRVISFFGNELPDGAMGSEVASWFWGDPLLLAVRDALVAHDTTTGSITSLLQEAKVDVVHIPGLMDHLSSAQYEKILIERLNLAAVIKSITNTLILDGGDGTETGGERWETRQLNFAGMPELHRTMFQLVAGAADIPATRLIGQAPTGLNSTGESDIRNYYDRLGSEQESDLSPMLAPLDEYLIQSATGSRDPSIFFDWNPLWQLTPKEKADHDKAVAETAQIYSNIGAFPADALALGIQNRVIEDGVFPGIEAAIEEAELEANMALPPVDLPDPGTEPPAPANANDPMPASQGANMTGNSRRRAASDRSRKIMRDRRTARAADSSTPRPLYVSRKVLNAAEIVKWAKGQGFTEIVAAEKMHVTIIASREPVDWLKVGGESWSGSSDDGKLTIAPGGPRVVERLGEGIVLMFNSWEMTYRHGSMREAGASFDFSDYQPHVTITYTAPDDDFDPSKIEPYTGEIKLGPEVFAEFVEDWRPSEVAAE